MHSLVLANQGTDIISLFFFQMKPNLKQIQIQMKNLILGFCLILMMSCQTDQIKTEKIMESSDAQNLLSEENIITDKSTALTSEPYQIKLDLHQLDNLKYNLEIQMFLNNEAYFVSPNAKGDFSGKFTFFIEENDSFILQGDLIESPLADKAHVKLPFIDDLENGVRENTSYKQLLQITNPDDFQINGYIQFTIEPRCTLEKIPIIIKSVNGKLKFEIFQC